MMNFNKKSISLIRLIGLIGIIVVSILLLAFQTDYTLQLNNKTIDANKTT
jgi:hypothetical protein